MPITEDELQKYLTNPLGGPHAEEVAQAQGLTGVTVPQREQIELDKISKLIQEQTAPPTKPPETKITITQPVGAQDADLSARFLPQGPVETEGGIGTVGQLLKGVVRGGRSAAADEVDTIDWLANKVADGLGLPRQEIVGKIKNAIGPEDLDQDEDTLMTTIGNAIGYGVAQVGLLYATILKPLRAAKILQATRMRQIPELATKAGRVAARGRAGVEAATKAAVKEGRAISPWVAPTEKATTTVGKVAKAMGNVGAVGPLGLGISGGIKGTKAASQEAEAEGKPQFGPAAWGGVKGFAQGVAMGEAFGLMERLPIAIKMPAFGTLFGGLSYLEGADYRQALGDFVAGVVLTLPGLLDVKTGKRKGVDPTKMKDTVRGDQTTGARAQTAEEILGMYRQEWKEAYVQHQKGNDTQAWFDLVNLAKGTGRSVDQLIQDLGAQSARIPKGAMPYSSELGFYLKQAGGYDTPEIYRWLTERTAEKKRVNPRLSDRAAFLDSSFELYNEGLEMMKNVATEPHSPYDPRQDAGLMAEWNHLFWELTREGSSIDKNGAFVPGQGNGAPWTQAYVLPAMAVDKDSGNVSFLQDFFRKNRRLQNRVTLSVDVEDIDPATGQPTTRNVALAGPWEERLVQTKDTPEGWAFKSIDNEIIPPDKVKTVKDGNGDVLSYNQREPSSVDIEKKQEVVKVAARMLGLETDVVVEGPTSAWPAAPVLEKGKEGAIKRVIDMWPLLSPSEKKRELAISQQVEAQISKWRAAKEKRIEAKKEATELERDRVTDEFLKRTLNIGLKEIRSLEPWEQGQIGLELAGILKELREGRSTEAGRKLGELEKARGKKVVPIKGEKVVEEKVAKGAEEKPLSKKAQALLDKAREKQQKELELLKASQEPNSHAVWVARIAAGMQEAEAKAKGEKAPRLEEGNPVIQVLMNRGYTYQQALNLWELDNVASWFLDPQEVPAGKGKTKPLFLRATDFQVTNDGRVIPLSDNAKMLVEKLLNKVHKDVAGIAFPDKEDVGAGYTLKERGAEFKERVEELKRIKFEGRKGYAEAREKKIAQAENYMSIAELAELLNLGAAGEKYQREQRQSKLSLLSRRSKQDRDNIAIANFYSKVLKNQWLWGSRSQIVDKAKQAIKDYNTHLNEWSTPEKPRDIRGTNKEFYLTPKQLQDAVDYIVMENEATGRNALTGEKGGPKRLTPKEAEKRWEGERKEPKEPIVEEDMGDYLTRRSLAPDLKVLESSFDQTIKEISNIKKYTPEEGEAVKKAASVLLVMEKQLMQYGAQFGNLARRKELVKELDTVVSKLAKYTDTENPDYNPNMNVEARKRLISKYTRRRDAILERFLPALRREISVVPRVSIEPYDSTPTTSELIRKRVRGGTVVKPKPLSPGEIEKVKQGLEPGQKLSDYTGPKIPIGNLTYGQVRSMWYEPTLGKELDLATAERQEASFKPLREEEARALSDLIVKVHRAHSILNAIRAEQRVENLPLDKPVKVGVVEVGLGKVPAKGYLEEAAERTHLQSLLQILQTGEGPTAGATRLPLISGFEHLEMSNEQYFERRKEIKNNIVKIRAKIRSGALSRTEGAKALALMRAETKELEAGKVYISAPMEVGEETLRSAMRSRRVEKEEATLEGKEPDRDVIGDMRAALDMFRETDPDYLAMVEGMVREAESQGIAGEDLVRFKEILTNEFSEPGEVASSLSTEKLASKMGGPTEGQLLSEVRKKVFEAQQIESSMRNSGMTPEQLSQADRQTLEYLKINTTELDKLESEITKEKEAKTQAKIMAGDIGGDVRQKIEGLKNSTWDWAEVYVERFTDIPEVGKAPKEVKDTYEIKVLRPSLTKREKEAYREKVLEIEKLIANRKSKNPLYTKKLFIEKEKAEKDYPWLKSEQAPMQEKRRSRKTTVINEQGVEVQIPLRSLGIRETEAGYWVSQEAIDNYEIKQLKKALRTMETADFKGQRVVGMRGRLHKEMVGKDPIWDFEWYEGSFKPGDRRNILMADAAERAVKEYMQERAPGIGEGRYYTFASHEGAPKFKEEQPPSIAVGEFWRVKKEYESKIGLPWQPGGNRAKPIPRVAPVRVELNEKQIANEKRISLGIRKAQGDRLTPSEEREFAKLNAAYKKSTGYTTSKDIDKLNSNYWNLTGREWKKGVHPKDKEVSKGHVATERGWTVQERARERAANEKVEEAYIKMSKEEREQARRRIPTYVGEPLDISRPAPITPEEKVSPKVKEQYKKVLATQKAAKSAIEELKTQLEKVDTSDKKGRLEASDIRNKISKREHTVANMDMVLRKLEKQPITEQQEQMAKRRKAREAAGISTKVDDMRISRDLDERLDLANIPDPVERNSLIQLLESMVGPAETVTVQDYDALTGKVSERKVTRAPLLTGVVARAGSKLQTKARLQAQQDLLEMHESGVEYLERQLSDFSEASRKIENAKQTSIRLREELSKIDTTTPDGRAQAEQLNKLIASYSDVRNLEAKRMDADLNMRAAMEYGLKYNFDNTDAEFTASDGITIPRWVEETRKVVNGYRENKDDFLKKLHENQAQINENGKVVDEPKPPITPLEGEQGGAGPQKPKAVPTERERQVWAELMTEGGTPRGLPGQHRFYQKPVENADKDRRRVVARQKAIDKKAAKEAADFEKKLKAEQDAAVKALKEKQLQGYRENLAPSLKQSQADIEKRAEANTRALMQRQAYQDVQKLVEARRQMFENEFNMSPRVSQALRGLTQAEKDKILLRVLDYQNSQDYITASVRKRMAEADQMTIDQQMIPITERLGQVYGVSNMDVKLMLETNVAEQALREKTLTDLIYGKGSWYERLDTALKDAGYTEANRGEILFNTLHYGERPTNPKMQEVLRIWNEGMNSFVSPAALKELGLFVETKLGWVPLIVDKNLTFKKLKDRWSRYREYKDVPNHYDITETEFYQVKDILERRNAFHRTNKDPFLDQEICNATEQKIIEKSLFQWDSTNLKEWDQIPYSVRERLSLNRDTWNKHLQRRADNVDYTAYKHDALQLARVYIHDMAKAQYMNNLKQSLAPIINKYEDLGPGSVKRYMGRYLDHAFGKWSQDERALGTFAEWLNEKVGRDIVSPTFLAKTMPGELTGGMAKGALGIIDSTFRNTTDAIKTIVEDPHWGATWLKSVFQWFKNYYHDPSTHGMGEYWPWLEAIGYGKETFYREAERIGGTFKERMARRQSILGKASEFYHWIGERLLSPFQWVESFTKGSRFLMAMNLAKERGADFTEAISLGFRSASTLVGDLRVPKVVWDGFWDTINTHIGYSDMFRTPYTRGVLGRISTMFWTYPADYFRWLKQGIGDGYKRMRQYHEYGQFARFAALIGFQATAVAGAAALGIDVANTWGLGMLPTSLFSLPWTTLCNAYKAVDPTRAMGLGAFTPEERDKATDAVINGIGMIFVPQYRVAKKVIKNVKALDEGFKTTLSDGTPIGEASTMDAILDMVGFPRVEPRETWELMAKMRNETYEYNKKKKSLQEDGIKALDSNNGQKINQILAAARQNGIDLDYMDLYKYRNDKQNLTILQKRLKTVPKALRPQFEAMIRELEARTFPSGTPATKPRSGNRGLWSNVME